MPDLALVVAFAPVESSTVAVSASAALALAGWRFRGVDSAEPASTLGGPAGAVARRGARAAGAAGAWKTTAVVGVLFSSLNAGTSKPAHRPHSVQASRRSSRAQRGDKSLMNAAATCGPAPGACFDSGCQGRCDCHGRAPGVAERVPGRHCDTPMAGTCGGHHFAPHWDQGLRSRIRVASGQLPSG